MRDKQFPTPQDAEAAFYEAFEKRDLEAMMAVWAADEEVVCIHPGGARLTGYEPVRESWRQIFASETGLRFELADQHCFQGAMLAIHIVHERITLPREERSAVIVATNVYVLTDQGWRMILHHASPAPDLQTLGPGGEGNRTLH